MSSEVEAAQFKLQSTGEDLPSSDEDDESKEDNASRKVLCDGCGGEFPSDQPGSEFEFAKLCSSCYDSNTNKDANNNTSPQATSTTTESAPQSTDGSSPRGSSPREESTVLEVSSGCEWDGGIDGDSDCEDDVECGLEMGTVLMNLRDNDIDRYDVCAGENELVFLPYVNDQDNITKNCRKFWIISPDTTPLLYGFRHFHAILNTSSKRGWLCHCRLTTLQENAVGNNDVLWEMWESRCNRKRYDGITIKEDGVVQKIQNVEKFLKKNGLFSDISKDYDHDFYQG